MIGISLRYECPSCGNILKTAMPFWSEHLRKQFKDPITRCACGRRGGFKLLSFEQCEFQLAQEDEKEEDEKKEEENNTDEDEGVFS